MLITLKLFATEHSPVNCEVIVKGKYLRGKCQKINEELVLHECRGFNCRIINQKDVEYFEDNICGKTISDPSQYGPINHNELNKVDECK